MGPDWVQPATLSTRTAEFPLPHLICSGNYPFKPVASIPIGPTTSFWRDTVFEGVKLRAAIFIGGVFWTVILEVASLSESMRICDFLA